MVSQGNIALDFTLETDRGEKVTLSQLRGRQVVLFFCPKDDTPGCTIECKQFRDAAPKFEGKKEHGPNGLQYLIEPKSAVELIEFLQQAHHIRSRRTHTPARSTLLLETVQAEMAAVEL
jgi:hypothetical protein